MSDAFRVALLQMQHGDSLDENFTRARDFIATAQSGGAQLAVLPEYWFAHGARRVAAADERLVGPATDRPSVRGDPSLGAPGGPDEGPALRHFFADASRDLGIALAGNLLEQREGALWNVGVVYERGASVLEQRKIHPMPREAAAGVVGGARLAGASVLGRAMGMLVCADILYPEAARVLALQGAEVLLNPVMSPYREVDNTKSARDAIFIARAYDSGAFVLKAAGFRRPEGDRTGIAGRSLVAAPWGILAHYAEDFQEEILFAELDFMRLAEFRKHQSSFPARRPDAYVGLL